MQPLVSVIMPTYNRQATVMRALDSVLGQTYANLEVIIVDDASTDSTVQLVNARRDDRVHLICLPENGGANAARNRGIAAARGEYIAFQDSDDEWDRDKLQVQIKDMLDRGLAASFCAHRLIRDVGEKIIPEDYEDKEKYEDGLRQVLAESNVISTQTLVVRKDVFSIIGNFDEDMPRLQDYEFVIRLSQKEKIGYIARPLVSVYRTGISISTNTEALYKAITLLLMKHGKFFKVNRFLASYLDTVVSEKEGSEVCADCVRLQKIMEDNGGELNVLQFALEHVAQKYCTYTKLQKKLYRHQMGQLETGRFVIYGAGNVAREIYRKLEKEEIYPKCFLVTSAKNEDAIGEIPIYTINEWDDLDIMVVVGVAAPLQDEIVDILIEKKYKNIICYSYF